MRLSSALAIAAPAALLAGQEGEHAKGFATILAKEIEANVTWIAAPELEGRDSPSDGLTRAAQFLEDRLKAYGAEPVEGSWRHSFTNTYTVPVEADCKLEFLAAEGETVEVLGFGKDFVPLPVCAGEAEGELVFAGFGLTDTEERYDDLKGVKVTGRVVLIVEGEPRHRKLFAGPELTRDADVHKKVGDMAKAGAAGVLVVRRSPAEATRGPDGKPIDPPALFYRHTWAVWADGRGYPQRERKPALPVLEITEAAASKLLGEDVVALAQSMDRRGKPEHKEREGSRAFLRTRFEERPVQMDNVVAMVPGTDETLASEIVVLGAHYDHIGVDPWGRIGCGADDNGSGTAALLELAEAFAAARPRRSVLFAFFAAEEDGLIGSDRFCVEPPIAKERMVAMLNMDMLGIGEEDEVAVIGTHVNPGFENILKRAARLKPTKVKTIETNQGRDLWERSDHYSFHKIGVPVLFFTEGYSETDNKDYHTYRDTIDTLDFEKIERSTRLVFNTAWLCANDDERPAKPR